MVCHPENSQALNVKVYQPAYFYSNVKSWLKGNDICDYLTSKLESELEQYVEQENWSLKILPTDNGLATYK